LVTNPPEIPRTTKTSFAVTGCYTEPAPRGASASRNPDVLYFGMRTMTIQVRGRGTLTLPASLREKYRLGEGDPLTVVDLDGAVLLSSRVLVVRRLAAEMGRLRRARKLSLKDLGGPARED
jgi:bifunctional DNA-binding transcriptional regulator/antitoxin component of YhaV-PrlF toxin-antitoxin module